jgi:hypothetical protein
MRQARCENLLMTDHTRSSLVPPIPARFEFSREFQLILACSWIAHGSNKALQASTVVTLCREGVDWNLFLSLLDRHKVSGIAYAVLTSTAKLYLPDDFKAELKDRKLRDWKTALVHANELVRLNNSFGRRGIDLLPLKGITLSLRLFGDPGMRHVRDLDLLVRPDDVDQSDEILRSEGYRRIHPELQATSGRKRLQLHHERHLEYYRDDLQVRVELHWKWDMLSPQKVSELWGHSHSIAWQGISFRMLDDDLLLLTLCDHGAGHHFTRLKWLSDCSMILVNTPHSSWDRVLEQAENFDMECPLAEGALLAEWLYGIELPRQLISLIRREKAAFRMACESIEHMFAEVKNAKDPQGQLSFLQYARRAPSQYIRAFRYTKSLRKRSNLHASLSRDLIRSADFDALPLPDRLTWLYYPLRPFLWLWRHATRSER